MRSVLVLPLALAAAGCWTPGTGEVDPTRYPWDQPARTASAPEPRYCVVALDPGPASGITFTGNAASAAACGLPAPTVRKIYPASTWKGVPAVARPAPPRREPTDAERFADECSDHALRRRALEERHGMTVRGPLARIDRAAWESGARSDWPAIRWSLAYAASCVTGRRGEHRVRIVDRQGRLLAWQRISTELQCSGDQALLRPDDVERPC